jgi:hypothetical protein
MFKLLLSIFLLFSISKANSGVGGISGGHINFQRDSTFINVLYSRSLCHDNYEFRAMSMKCVKWTRDDDGRTCEQREKFEISQPLESTRKRCDQRDSDGNCDYWKTIRFYQSPKRIVKILDDDDHVIEKRKVIIPLCR